MASASVTRLGAGLVLALVAASTFGACAGGGGNAAPTATDTAATEIASPIPTANLPTAVVNGKLIDSSAVGYTADLPDGWTLRSNFLLGAVFTGDAIFAPSSGPLQPNIAVLCRHGTADMLNNYSLAQFTSDQVDQLNALGRENVRIVRDLVVDDQPARQIEFGLRRPDASFDGATVLFISGKCAWAITLTAPADGIDAYRGKLTDFLASFKAKGN